MAQNALPGWIKDLEKRNPRFAEMYLAQRDRVLKDGAIPAKYKILMTMIVDSLMSHPDGVAAIANRARSAGATEAEINEAVEVAYLFGGTPALVTATNAFRASV
jgi:alkylhydroperoxidase/carboxymuconolactone decarboxylase family protein YurZ